MICGECGARVSEGAERCDLCGTKVPRQALETEDSAEASASQTRKPGAPKSFRGERALVCPACGRKNRPDALFCDQCATPLERVRSVPEAGPKQRRAKTLSRKPQGAQPVGSKAPSGRSSGSAPGNGQPKSRVGLLLLSGIVLVAVLYGITILSKSRQADNPVPATQQESTPATDSYLPEDAELAAEARTIRAAIEEASDPAREVALRSQLVELYASNGRLDLAGREQDRIAEVQNTAEDWTLAGNLHFDWMERQSGQERVKAARRAVISYNRSLELEPDNLDVRTDLGVAYLNDPGNAMLAIQETNAVLEANPEHVQANFNKGVMLLQIGRRDEAVAHFEKVRSLTEPGSAPHERATSVLNQIRETSE